MPAAIREAFLTALKAKLESIDGTGDNRTTVNKVEFAARGWEDVPADSEADGRTWIGIVPQRETGADFPGRVEITWPIDLLMHSTNTARTEAEDITDLSDLANDIRRVLYADATLSVSGVIMVRIVSRLGTEGVPEAVDEGIASAIMQIEALMEEAIGAA